MANITNELVFSHPRVRILHKTGTGNKAALTAIGSTQTQSVSYQETEPYGSTLIVGIKPNQFQFAYNLNSQSYPTYAGEVVQILSAYIDDVTIEGDIRTYSDMELIYKWFIAYMTIATQGVTGAPTLSNLYHYDDTPVSMSYPHRGWTLNIRPNSLPSLTYGTDVVVPNWQFTASVVEDENMNLTTMMNSNLPALAANQLKTLNGNFGTGIENPFNYWSGSYNQADITKYLTGNAQKQIENFNPNSTQLTDWYSSLVSQYAQGDVELDSSPFSKPYTKQINVSSTISAGSNTTGTSAGSVNLNPSLNSPVLTPPTISVVGTLPTIGSNGYATSPKGVPAVIQSVIAAGNQIITYPYIWGGGHTEFAPTTGTSVGASPGQWDGVTVGFDCCLPGHMRVYTPEGPVPIVDVKAGDRVYAWDHNQLVESTVIRRSTARHQETFLLTTKRGKSTRSIEASGNHPFLRIVPDWSHRYSRTNGPRPIHLEWTNLEDLNKDDLIVISDHITDHFWLTYMELSTEEEKFWWLVGIFVGDGHLPKDADRNKKSGINICVFDGLRDRVQDVLEELTGRRGTQHPAHGIYIRSYELRERLVELGFEGVYSHTKVMPDMVWSLSPKLQRCFLLGYQEADGSYSKRDKCIEYKCTSRDLMDQIQILHSYLGDHVTNIRKFIHKKPIVIKGKLIKNAKPRWEFTARPMGSNLNSGVRSRMSTLNTAFPSNCPFRFEVIKSIASIGSQDTYDLTIADTHNFIAEGYVVHNSGSVSYALHGGGLISSPMGSTEFETFGEQGEGEWITIFTNASHVYMFVGPNIAKLQGIIFDTVDLGTATPPGSGPRWFPGQDLPDSTGFIIRHPTGY